MTHTGVSNTMAKNIMISVAATLFANEAVETWNDDALKALNVELEERKLPVKSTVEDSAELLACNIRSLDEFAATMVNLSKGTITGKDLTTLMAQAFPEHGISDRHGPHYLSSVRTEGKGGRVTVRFIPESRRNTRPAPAPVVVTETRVVEVQAERVDLSDIPTKQLDRLIKLVPTDSVLGQLIANSLAAAKTAASAAEAAIVPQPVAEGEPVANGLQNDVTVA